MNIKSKSENASVDDDSQVDLTAVEIKRAREAAKLSVLELSAKTGISKTVLHGYERGRTRPGARELRLICQTLDVSPNRLLFGLDEYETERDGFAKLLKLSRTNPMVTHLFMMLAMPMVLALLDEKEAESLMVLITSLVKAKDQATAAKIIAMVEVISANLSVYGDPNESATKLPSKEQIEKIQNELKEKLKNLENKQQ